MTPLTLHDPQTGSTARILPELGFNCFEWQARLGGRVLDVLDAEPGFEAGGCRPSKSGIPLLFPYPNRIRAGRYTWDGRSYELTEVLVDDFGNAIHGLTLDRAWRVVASGESFAVGRFQLSVDAPERAALWPADFVIDVRYEVAGPVLRSEIRIANPDTRSLPWGFGTHSYFRVPLAPTSRRSACLVQVPAAERWELSQSLPTGVRRAVRPEEDLREGEPLGERQFDDVLTGVEVGQGGVTSVLMDPEAGLQLTQRTSADFRELVVFTPPHGRSICMEPYTCVTDAIHLQQQGVDAGWRVLPPGAEVRLQIVLELGPVLA